MSAVSVIARACVSSLCLLAACASPPPAPPPPEGAPADFPVPRYADIDGSDRLFAVNPERSLAVITVRRGGALARLGHDHVVAARDIRGFVRFSEGHVVADLYATLAGMSVDEESLRSEAGFTTEPSAEDKAGTRANMLESVDATTFPFVQVALTARVGSLEGAAETVDAGITISLHGEEHQYTVPVVARVSADALTAQGSLTIRQSDFGIEPFSVLGGALTVLDELEIRFEIEALRRYQSAVSHSGSARPFSAMNAGLSRRS